MGKVVWKSDERQSQTIPFVQEMEDSKDGNSRQGSYGQHLEREHNE